MHHFCPAIRPTHQVLQGQISNPHIFALMDVVWLYIYLGTKELTKTCISTPMPPSWQGNGTNPAPHSHPWPQNHWILCRNVTFMYRNHCVTSNVQFMKGALIPFFWVGLGWADYWWVVLWRGEFWVRGTVLAFYRTAISFFLCLPCTLCWLILWGSGKLGSLFNGCTFVRVCSLLFYLCQQQTHHLSCFFLPPLLRGPKKQGSSVSKLFLVQTLLQMQHCMKGKWPAKPWALQLPIHYMLAVRYRRWVGLGAFLSSPFGVVVFYDNRIKGKPVRTTNHSVSRVAPGRRFLPRQFD